MYRDVGQQNIKKAGNVLRPQPLLMQIWFIDMSMVGRVATGNSLFPVSNYVRLKFNQTQKPEETKN
jgi:hypothetical protein